MGAKRRFQSQLVQLITAAVLLGCAATPPVNLFHVPDQVVQRHAGDLGGLYDRWIVPASLERRPGHVVLSTNQDRAAAEQAIADVFARFCLASQGMLVMDSEQAVGHFRCDGSEGTDLGALAVTRLNSNALSVVYDSPALRAQQAARKAAREELLARGDLSGIVELNGELVRFSRVGSANEAHHLGVFLRRSWWDRHFGDDVKDCCSTAEARWASLHDVRRVIFPADGGPAEVILRDGARHAATDGDLYQFSEAGVFGYLAWGRPLVLQAINDDGEVVPRLLSVRQIQSITIEPSQ